MATYKDFEEVDLWKKADNLSAKVYRAIKNGDFNNDWYVRNQLKSSSVSIMSNISEGFEREGNKELVQFLYIAKGSAGELRSLAHVARREQYINESVFEEIRRDAISMSKMIAGFIRYLKSAEIKGNKFKKSAMFSNEI